MENKKEVLKLIIAIIIITLMLTYLMAIPIFMTIIKDLAALWFIFLALRYFIREMRKKETNN